jgi:hypothetical protein
MGQFIKDNLIALKIFVEMVRFIFLMAKSAILEDGIRMYIMDLGYTTMR